MSFLRPPATGPRHRWKVLAIGVTANASFAAAFSGIPTTAVLMRAAYHLSNAELGLILGLMGLGIALSELPWGMLTDRWGDRPVLLTGLSATAAGLVALALWAAPAAPGAAAGIPGVPLLGGGLLLVGMLGGSVNGASGRAVMVWFSAGERGLAMSIRQTAVPLGGALGALLLPWFALHLGYTAVYGALALGCAFSAALTWCWLVEPPWLAAAASAKAEDKAGDKTVGITAAKAGAKTGAGAQPSGAASACTRSSAPLRDRQLLTMVLGIGVLCAPQFALLSFGTVFLHDFAHAGVAATTGAMVALQCGAMAMRVWSGRWTDRNGHRRDYLRGCAGLSAGLLVLLAVLTQGIQCLQPASAGTAHALPWGLPLLAVWVALCGICVSAWHGVAYAELVTLSGARRAGTALGMANTCVFVACFLTPLAIPHLLSRADWPGVWCAGALCAVLARACFTQIRGSAALPQQVGAR